MFLEDSDFEEDLEESSAKQGAPNGAAGRYGSEHKSNNSG